MQDCSRQARYNFCQWVRSSASRRAGRSPAGSHARRGSGAGADAVPGAAEPADISRAPPLASQHSQLPAGPSLLPPRVLSPPSRGAARSGQPERREGWRCGSTGRGPRRLHRGPGPRLALGPAVSARADGAGAARPLPRAPGRWAAGGSGRRRASCYYRRRRLCCGPAGGGRRRRPLGRSAGALGPGAGRWGGGPGRARAGRRRERSPQRRAAEKGKWDKMAGETRARPGARQQRQAGGAVRVGGGGGDLLNRTFAVGRRPPPPGSRPGGRS